MEKYTITHKKTTPKGVVLGTMGSITCTLCIANIQNN
nr:MAG TPA: hypothetical protein [Caudoviricetes sp.]